MDVIVLAHDVIIRAQGLLQLVDDCVSAFDRPSGIDGHVRIMERARGMRALVGGCDDQYLVSLGI